MSDLTKSRTDRFVESPEKLDHDKRWFWCDECGAYWKRHHNESGDKFCPNCEWREGVLLSLTPVGKNAANYWGDADG